MVGSYAARKAVTGFQRSFSRQSTLGREFRDVGEDFRAEPELTEQILKSLLDSEILPGSIFRRDGVEQLVYEHYQQNKNHERIIGLLISLGLGMKYFLHDDFSDVPRDMYIP